MKNPLMRASNLALYLIFCGLAGTGLLMKYRLPPGSRGGHGLSALGMTRHEWGDIHLWLAWAVLAITLLHMALNWRWLKKIAARGMWAPLLGGLALGGIVLAVPLALPVARPPAAASTANVLPADSGKPKAIESCATCPSAAPGGECSVEKPANPSIASPR